MTAKETLWSLILIVVMAGAVYFGNIAMNKCYDRSMEIYDIREKSVRYDSQIEQIDNAIPRTEARITSLNNYIEMYREKVREKQKELSYEDYLAYRKRNSTSRSYEDYCHLINLSMGSEVDKVNKLIAQRDELQKELDGYKDKQIAEMPKLKQEREEFNTAYANQINENVDASKNEYYYMQAFCVAIMVSCFLILMRICPPFRYVVYSIAAVATVNHISNKFKGE